MRYSNFNETQYVAASMLAALVPSGVVLIAGLLGFLTAPLWTVGNELDDAPIRVAGIAVVSFIPIYLFYLFLFYLSARILALFGVLSRRKLITFTIVVLAIAVFWFVRFESWKTPSLDELKSFAFFFLVFGAFTIGGAYVWWKTAHNNALQSDA